MRLEHCDSCDRLYPPDELEEVPEVDGFHCVYCRADEAEDDEFQRIELDNPGALANISADVKAGLSSLIGSSAWNHVYVDIHPTHGYLRWTVRLDDGERAQFVSVSGADLQAELFAMMGDDADDGA